MKKNPSQDNSRGYMGTPYDRNSQIPGKGAFAKEKRPPDLPSRSGSIGSDNLRNNGDDTGDHWIIGKPIKSPK